MLNAFLRRGYKGGRHAGQERSSCWGAFRRGQVTVALPRVPFATEVEDYGLSASGAAPVPLAAALAGKSLKEQNRWQIWMSSLVFRCFLYGVAQRTR